MWLEHKAPQWKTHCGDEDMERWKTRIFSLRGRMLSFVRQVLAFATGEVLESNWKALEVKLAKVQTVDQLLRDHVDFLDTCLKQCMLTTSKLLGVSPCPCFTGDGRLMSAIVGVCQVDDHDVGFCVLSSIVQHRTGQVYRGSKCRV